MTLTTERLDELDAACAGRIGSPELISSSVCSLNHGELRALIETARRAAEALEALTSNDDMRTSGEMDAIHILQGDA